MVAGVANRELDRKKEKAGIVALTYKVNQMNGWRGSFGIFSDVLERGRKWESFLLPIADFFIKQD